MLIFGLVLVLFRFFFGKIGEYASERMKNEHSTVAYVHKNETEHKIWKAIQKEHFLNEMQNMKNNDEICK